MSHTIVAEISKIWPEQKGSTNFGKKVCNLFEEVIAFNNLRGYRLRDWRFSQAVLEPGFMVETIIAVFEKDSGGG